MPHTNKRRSNFFDYEITPRLVPVILNYFLENIKLLKDPGSNEG